MSYQKVYMNQIYSSSIMRQVAQMWKNQLLCDAVIKTGNVQTKAHRLVLIAACPMLQDRENASIGSHLEVRLNSDISQKAVNTFLQYLYEGHMMLTEENCREVEKIAKMLHVDSISKCCSDFQKCMNVKTGYSSYQGPNFDLQDSVDFRFVYTTDLQKMATDSQSKRQFDDANLSSPASKRPRSQVFQSVAQHRPDDHISMNDSYVNLSRDRPGAGSQDEGVIDISENSVELVNVGPAAHDSDGWPMDADLPPIKTSSSVSVARQQGSSSDVQIIDVQPGRAEQQSGPVFGRMEESRSDTSMAGTSSGVSRSERPAIASQSHIPSTVRQIEDSTSKYMPSSAARDSMHNSSPLSSSPPKSVHNQKQRVVTDDLNRPYALGSASSSSSDHGPTLSMQTRSSFKSSDEQNVYGETQSSSTNDTKRGSFKSSEEQRPRTASPEPIIVKLEDDSAESGSVELYIQNPSNDSYNQDPGGEGLGEADPDLSNDASMNFGSEQPYQSTDDQSQEYNLENRLEFELCSKIEHDSHLQQDRQSNESGKMCTACHVTFDSCASFQFHVLSTHPLEWTKCLICGAICGAGVKNRSNYFRHIASHFPDKPFKCWNCGKGFKRKDKMKFHARKCGPQ